MKAKLTFSRHAPKSLLRCLTGISLAASWLLFYAACPGGLSREFGGDGLSSETPAPERDAAAKEAALKESPQPDKHITPEPGPAEVPLVDTERPDPGLTERGSPDTSRERDARSEKPGSPDNPTPKDTWLPPEIPQDRGNPPPSRCERKKPPTHTGKTLTLSAGGKLADVLKQAMGGDRIVVKQGTFVYEKLTGVKFNSYVIIVAETGATVTFEGLEFQNSAYLSFQNIQFRKKSLGFRDCHHIWLDRVDVDMGTIATSGMTIVGGGSSTSSHDFEVHNSRFSGGQRTIFIRTNFNIDTYWNHNLSFTHNKVECGTSTCFQLSGARDMGIVDNDIKTRLGGVGILLAGATRIQILRNTVVGDKDGVGGSTGMNIATPGKEWDNYKNVKYMITSQIKIGNNLVYNWKNIGIALQGTHHIDIFNNTIFGNNSLALRLSRRIPHAYTGEVILTGNKDIRLWNNIMDKISYDKLEPRPTLESNNLVSISGGGGTGLIKADPRFQGANNFRLTAGSPAIDAGLVNKDTPKIDLYLVPRDAKPDLGAIEAGSLPPKCP